jgi:hypothetical protein
MDTNELSARRFERVCTCHAAEDVVCGDERITVYPHHCPVEYRLQSPLPLTQSPDDWREKIIAAAEFVAAATEWSVPAVLTPETLELLSRWLDERWAMALDRHVVYDEPRYDCEHMIEARRDQPGILLWWFPRFPMTMLCGDCGVRLRAALLRCEPDVCDNCGDSPPLLNVRVLLGSQKTECVVLCDVCDPDD